MIQDVDPQTVAAGVTFLLGVFDRAFGVGNSLTVMCHEEPHWYSHPVAHLRSKHMEHEAANEWTKKRLENQVPVGYPSD